MANDSKGLVMYDNDYVVAATYISNYCSSLVGIINAYTNTLNDITDGAVVDQRISSALIRLSNQTAPLMQVVSEIGEEAATACREFTSAVDAADSFLY